VKTDNAALLSVFLSGAVAFRRAAPVTANPYKARQIWNAWGDGWRYMKSHPTAGRRTLNTAFNRRGPQKPNRVIR